MKMNKILTSIMLLVLLFSVGCGDNTSQPNLEEDIYRGNEALEMEFLRDVPPVQTFAQTGDLFEVALEMKNLGTYPLRGKLFLSGFDPNVFNKQRIFAKRNSLLSVDTLFVYSQRVACHSAL